MHGIWLWALHVTGADDESGTFYGFWSGFAGDIPLFVGVFIFYARHICHEHGCHRLSLHHNEGPVVCKKHNKPLKS
jgi:hypothetical protein